MRFEGKRFEKTNNGTPCIGTEDQAFDAAEVSRWGLYECYGISGSTLVAEVNGEPVAVYVSKQTGDALREAKRIRKAEGKKVSGSALSYIRRTLKSAGIVWASDE